MYFLYILQVTHNGSSTKRLKNTSKHKLERTRYPRIVESLQNKSITTDLSENSLQPGKQLQLYTFQLDLTIHKEPIKTYKTKQPTVTLH